MVSTNKSVQSGFSLVELMISLVIILAIIGMIAPSFSKIMGRGDLASTKNLLKTLTQAILEYKADVHVYPETLADLDKRPEGINGWNGSYLPDKMQGKEIVDMWNQPVVYKKNAKGVKPAYELYSNGDPDKEENRIDAE